MNEGETTLFELNLCAPVWCRNSAKPQLSEKTLNLFSVESLGVNQKLRTDVEHKREGDNR